MGPPLHPLCQPLAGLLGTWRGRGEGDYPTIEGFGYVEEVVYSHVGKPFVAYTQRTRDAGTDLPLHAEAGYLRGLEGGGIELVLVQPSGIVEIHCGTVTPGEAGDATHIALHTVQVACSPTAKDATEVQRTIDVDGDAMTYRLAMAAVGQHLQPHLSAELRRVE